MCLKMLPLRLCGVVGYEGRINDIVYCRSKSPCDSITVFFGGDVQDFAEVMETRKENESFLKWNLENTAYLIGKTFPQSHVIVVRPSNIKYKTFSCFKNFVESSDYGVPQHTPMHHSLNHLKKLLENAEVKLQSLSKEDMHDSAKKSKKYLFISDDEKTELLSDCSIGKNQSIDVQNVSLRLMGFSKGCVVLNQFLYEFHQVKSEKNLIEEKELGNIISRIKDMYWIDGGHSGGQNTWITSRQILETFAGLGIKTHIHVSPYQINDVKRPWIKKEEKQFYECLKGLGVQINHHLHFEDQEPSLDLHFSILNELT